MREWEKNLRQVTPYVAGEQPKDLNKIKLNTNENPYPPTKNMEGLLNNQSEMLRLYPDTQATELVEELARFYDLTTDQIFVGVGSDDVLAMSFLTFFNSEKPILFPDITYSFYDVWANLYRIPYERPALDENFHIKKEDYYKVNGGIVIANPNAPTSISEDLSVIEDIIAKNQDAIVIIDEAYVDFGGQSALPLLKKYDNLVVVQTFSKSRSMAGMRIGYAMANPELITALKNVKESYNSYTMNYPSIVCGAQAVRDKDYFYETLDKVIATREHVKRELRGLGFQMPDSKTNFLFITHEKLSAKELFEALREEHIYVRHFNKPRISNYLRVSIGTDEEMNIFLRAVMEYMKEKGILN
ncbi:histidinol-phosphate transaminase [Lachnoclostridium phytofermentans]|uniref:histidinol-phosphate transaminase n=1 Tax=Lachnoclostridium phytofermentans TaxID=66219 RepID=UPI0004958851